MGLEDKEIPDLKLLVPNTLIKPENGALRILVSMDGLEEYRELLRQRFFSILSELIPVLHFVFEDSNLNDISDFEKCSFFSVFIKVLNDNIDVIFDFFCEFGHSEVTFLIIEENLKPVMLNHFLPENFIYNISLLIGKQYDKYLINNDGNKYFGQQFIIDMVLYILNERKNKPEKVSI